MDATSSFGAFLLMAVVASTFIMEQIVLHHIERGGLRIYSIKNNVRFSIQPNCKCTEIHYDSSAVCER